MMESVNKIAVIICTHNRIRDARINQEIIRYHWPVRSKMLNNVLLIHAFNGKNKWYSSAYLENDIIRTNNSNLSQGNSDLIDQSIIYLSQQYPEVKYVVVLNADTWALKPQYIQSVICEMESRDMVMAASSYVGEKSEFFRGGLASDFFILNVPFAVQSGMIPLRYKEFEQKYWDLMLYYSADMAPILEKVLFARLSEALFKSFNCQNPGEVVKNKLLRLKEREPFYKHGSDVERVWYWPEAGILSDHSIKAKREVLYEQEIKPAGKYLKELLEGGSLSEEAA